MSSNNRIAKQYAYLHTLQLDQNVTDPKLVRKQFRKLAAQHHPDHVSPDEREKATEMMKNFEQAKSWLLDNITTVFSTTEIRDFDAEKEERRRKRQKRRRAAAKEQRRAAERKKELLRRRAKKQKKQSLQLNVPNVSRKRTKLGLKWSCKLKKVRFVLQLNVDSTWTDVYSGKKKSCSLTGLQPGTKHEFRLGYTQDRCTTFEVHFTGVTLGV